LDEFLKEHMLKPEDIPFYFKLETEEENGEV
jgi:hypothetical protein